MSRDPLLIHEGGNSGYQAINLAYHAGAAHIVLLGFDMKTNGKRHWFGDHPTPALNVSSPYDVWIPKFGPLAADLAADGVAVTNCCTDSALGAFVRRPLSEALP